MFSTGVLEVSGGSGFWPGGPHGGRGHPEVAATAGLGLLVVVGAWPQPSCLPWFVLAALGGFEH